MTIAPINASTVPHVAVSAHHGELMSRVNKSFRTNPQRAFLCPAQSWLARRATNGFERKDYGQVLKILSLRAMG